MPRSRSPGSRHNDPPSRRSRSRSPRIRSTEEHRERRDRPLKERGGGGGFRWKEKKKDTLRDTNEEPRQLERGYRKRSTSPRRQKSSAAEGTVNVEDKFGVADKFGTGSAKRSKTDETQDGPPKRAPAAASPAVASGEQMIIVHVNDRMGTKAAIPCLASDPIKLFKAQVAARIGRQPHEILLKRQGERPFKDQLTLEDYGVGNGVQLDLEVDTGD